jgi:hypothetical protein
MRGHWNIGDNPLGLELAEAAEGDRAALLQRSIPGWAGARRALMAGAHGGCGATRQSCPVALLKRVVGRGLRRSWREGKTTLVRLAEPRWCAPCVEKVKG